MALEKGATVILHDEHSEYDGETGEITRVSETMFGDENYTVSFEDGKEPSVPENSLELVDDEDEEVDASAE